MTAADQAASELGGIDYVVANAGISDASPGSTIEN